MIPGAVHRFPGISLTAEKTPGKPQFDEGTLRPVIASNGVPFLQMRSVGSHRMSVREKEGKYEGSILAYVAILTKTGIKVRMSLTYKPRRNISSDKDLPEIDTSLYHGPSFLNVINLTRDPFTVYS